MGSQGGAIRQHSPAGRRQHTPRAARAVQTLARLLRDDYKKSSELCLNLVSVFFGLSHFAQLHPLLVQVHVGRGRGGSRQRAAGM